MHSNMQIFIMTLEYFLQGTLHADTARNFRMWLLQIIATNGGGECRFQTEREFKLTNVIMYHQMPAVSYNIIFLANNRYVVFFTDCN